MPLLQGGGARPPQRFLKSMCATPHSLPAAHAQRSAVSRCSALQHNYQGSLVATQQPGNPASPPGAPPLYAKSSEQAR